LSKKWGEGKVNHGPPKKNSTELKTIEKGTESRRRGPN